MPDARVDVLKVLVIHGSTSAMGISGPVYVNHMIWMTGIGHDHISGVRLSTAHGIQFHMTSHHSLPHLGMVSSCRILTIYAVAYASWVCIRHVEDEVQGSLQSYSSYAFSYNRHKLRMAVMDSKWMRPA